MKVYITNETNEKKWNRYRKVFDEIAQKSLTLTKSKLEGNLSVVFVDSQKIQQINKEYRDKDIPTDVISFALLDTDDVYMIDEELEIGDIFINIEAIYKQARAYEHSLKREVCFLFTHGLLHLLGYDHLEVLEEKVMFDLQDAILENLVNRRYKNYENSK